MIYRRFGRTGLQISVLSAGFMRAMHSWQVLPSDRIPFASQQNLEEIVRFALELGINHFETAHAYGTSEQQLGQVLRDIPRESYILQTKVQPVTDPARFVSDVHASLGRLQVDRIDLLAIHGINDYHSLWQVCRTGGCLAAARRLQKEGKVGAVGFSGHGSEDVIVTAIGHEGDGGFDYVNLHWYYIYQVNSRALQEAASRNMGVFIISPTDKGGMLQQPPDIFCTLCRPLEPMAFNDLYCLRRPEVHTISIGAARPSDFQAHGETLAFMEAEDLLDRIDDRCCRAMEVATGFTRPEALWSKLPSWEETPGLINIPFILWLYNLARGWGMLAYSRRRYSKLGHDVKWVPGNNGAMVAQYDLRSVAEGAGLRNNELVSLLEEAHRMLSPQ